MTVLGKPLRIAGEDGSGASPDVAMYPALSPAPNRAEKCFVFQGLTGIVRSSPSAPMISFVNQVFDQSSRSFSHQNSCCVLYLRNPLNIRPARLIPSSPCNTDATQRFRVCSKFDAGGE